MLFYPSFFHLIKNTKKEMYETFPVLSVVSLPFFFLSFFPSLSVSFVWLFLSFFLYIPFSVHLFPSLSFLSLCRFSMFLCNVMYFTNSFLKVCSDTPILNFIAQVPILSSVRLISYTYLTVFHYC